MPYITESYREKLDTDIDCIVGSIKSNLLYPNDPKAFWNMAGDINYCFTRILCQLLGDVSYSKIALATGVLENIKQEFYRRLASPYEDSKMINNGDIPEYKGVENV